MIVAAWPKRGVRDPIFGIKAVVDLDSTSKQNAELEALKSESRPPNMITNEEEEEEELSIKALAVCEHRCGR